MSIWPTPRIFEKGKITAWLAPEVIYTYDEALRAVPRAAEGETLDRSQRSAGPLFAQYQCLYLVVLAPGTSDKCPFHIFLFGSYLSITITSEIASLR